MLVLFATFTLSGCFENVKGIVLSPKTSTSASTTTSSYAFNLTAVVLDQSDPTGTFDVKGDGSYSISKYCTAAATANNAGATNCNCVYDFNYTNPTTGKTTSQELTADTTYSEADLVHCPYASIPPSVSLVSVSLATKNGVSKSNALSFNFGTSNSVLDTSKDYNFARVFRYTCRQKVYVENALDSISSGSGVYDPYQSEGDPANSYPTSFYTTNLGAALTSFASKIGSSVISDYECPANPTHPTSDFSETIYSTAAGPDGKYVISGDPGATNVNMNRDNPRSTFFLSKLKTNIFTINVNAYIAPNRVSAESSTTIPSLGYGASPRATGTGTETCPADTPTTNGVTNADYVTIPSGYHWVKVWLFRMALPARQYLYGSNLQRLGAIGCNPGNWTPTYDTGNVNDIYNSEFPDCFGLTALGGGTAARFSQGFGMCFQPNSWTPNGKDQYYSCGKSNQVPYANVPSVSLTGGLGICSAGAATSATPTDSAPLAKYIDDPNSLRYEFLFVVTPKTVNSGDMSNSSSPVYAQYAPFRFRVNSDCSSTDPTACPTQYMFRNYGLKLHDVATAGDPPANDSSRAGTFPLCALQPDSVLGTGI
jgi:hypothetical protein